MDIFKWLKLPKNAECERFIEKDNSIVSKKDLNNIITYSSDMISICLNCEHFEQCTPQIRKSILDVIEANE